MTVLAEAVRAEDPTATVLVNSYTDIPLKLAQLLSIPTWQAVLQQWRPLYDAIGVDAYPNQLAALPLRSDLIGARVADAVAIGKTPPGNPTAAAVAPVWVTETAYPAIQQNYSFIPQTLNFSMALQSQYFQEAVKATVDNGGTGFFAFGMWLVSTAPLLLPSSCYTNRHTPTVMVPASPCNCLPPLPSPQPPVLLH